MRLSLKRLFHWMRKRTADNYPHSQGLNGLRESLADSSGFGGDPSPVQYENLDPWGDGSSVFVSAGCLASGSSNYL